MSIKPAYEELEQRVRELESAETERNKTLLRATTLLDSVRRAQSLYIEEIDPQRVFDELLDIVVSITESEFGFLDEVRYEPDGTPYKLSLSLSNIAWDDASRSLYDQLRSRHLEFRNLDNLAGLPATMKKPIIANDAPHDKRSGGLPPGHPAISTFMGLPVRSRGELVGVIGVANRKKGYDPSVADFLEPYLNACAVIIQAIRLRAKEQEAVGEIKRQKEIHQAIIDNAHTHLVYLDADFNFVAVNAAYAETCHRTPEELIGKNHFFFYPNRENEEIFKQVRDTGESMAFHDKPFEFPDQPERGVTYWDWTLSPVLDRDGAVKGLVYSLVETTERVRAKEALKESESKFRILVDQAPEALFLHDMKGRIVDVNQATVIRYGFSRDELLRMSSRDIDPDYVEREDGGVFWGKLKEKKQIRFEARHQRKDGSIFPVEISLAAIELGQQKFILALADDITDRKQAEEDRKRFQEQFLKIHEMETVGRLAGGVAHEFNNALTAVMGNMDLLITELPEYERYIHYFKTMEESCLRMSRLTKQLVAYAREGKYQPRRLRLDEFIMQSLPIVRHGTKPSVEVETHFLEDSPAHIEADQTQMQMILAALLTNSGEAMENGGVVRLLLQNETLDEGFCQGFAEAKPGRYICLSVQDDGKGMTDDVKRRIFEPFFTTKFQGRGMGMAAVYGIVKNHGGLISVDSELGKGTLVKIYFPAVGAEERKEESPASKPLEGMGAILVIEDQEMVLEATQAMLERLGYWVIVAKTGADAVKMAETSGGLIDLALLDLKLPDMEGREIYPLLIKACPQLKVIVFSGYDVQGPVQEILDAGAQGFIQKPFSFSSLSKKVKNVLEGSYMTQ